METYAPSMTSPVSTSRTPRGWRTITVGSGISILSGHRWSFRDGCVDEHGSKTYVHPRQPMRESRKPRMTRPFRFAVQVFKGTKSSAEWADLVRRIEDLGYSTLLLA